MVVINNVIEIKSFDFAVRIVNLYKHLTTDKKEFVLSKQLLRSGTSIGANVSEAEKAASDADFNAKMNISLKEANETAYLLKLLYRTEYINPKQYKSMYNDFLVSICNTSKAN